MAPQPVHHRVYSNTQQRDLGQTRLQGLPRLQGFTDWEKMWSSEQAREWADFFLPFKQQKLRTNLFSLQVTFSKTFECLFLGCQLKISKRRGPNTAHLTCPLSAQQPQPSPSSQHRAQQISGGTPGQQRERGVTAARFWIQARKQMARSHLPLHLQMTRAFSFLRKQKLTFLSLHWKAANGTSWDFSPSSACSGKGGPCSLNEKPLAWWGPLSSQHQQGQKQHPQPVPSPWTQALSLQLLILQHADLPGHHQLLLTGCCRLVAITAVLRGSNYSPAAHHATSVLCYYSPLKAIVKPAGIEHIVISDHTTDYIWPSDIPNLITYI